jgi:carbon monoxide dehydrogenase subunit G
MVIEETLKTGAPIQKIWETMLDVSFLLSCIPGIERLEVVNDSTYNVILRTKVSVISAVFDMVITIIDRQEPVYIKVAGEGKGRMGLGRVAFNQTVSLEPVSARETEVAYKLELNVIGRLAGLGGKAIAKKVTEVSEAFRDAFIAKCEG